MCLNSTFGRKCMETYYLKHLSITFSINKEFLNYRYRYPSLFCEKYTKLFLKLFKNKKTCLFECKKKK